MKLTPDILTVLSGLTYGKQTMQRPTRTVDFVRIEGLGTDKQLPSKLYKKVNDVIASCGGTWSRTAKAHLFEPGVDAAALIDRAITVGEIVTATEAAQEIGFFPTPAQLAADLVKRAGVKKGDFVLEPSAGTGRIVDAILAAGGRPIACERDPAMRVDLEQRIMGVLEDDWFVESGDFLDLELELEVDAVVMNPPFCVSGKGDHLDHVQHAFGMLKRGGRLVSVLPISVEFREDARHRAFRQWYTKGQGTVTKLPSGSFKESGTNVETCVLKMVRT